MTLVDTHTHLYLDVFSDDIDQLLADARTKGLSAVYLPAIDSETHQVMVDMEDRYAGFCHAMIGLHPCSVKEDYKQELSIVEEWLSRRRFAGIGETGLDFYWDKTYVKEQFMALEQQMTWALELDLPIILHTRNATQETIDAVRPFAKRGLRGIFHCFGGSREEANQVTDMGFYLGIGGVLTYKNSGLQQAIQDIPLEHIVLETDAPYLSPVPHRGKRNIPVYLFDVLYKLAEIKSMVPEEVAEITSRNAGIIFAGK